MLWDRYKSMNKRTMLEIALDCRGIPRNSKMVIFHNLKTDEVELYWCFWNEILGYPEGFEISTVMGSDVDSVIEEYDNEEDRLYALIDIVKENFQKYE